MVERGKGGVGESGGEWGGERGGGGGGEGGRGGGRAGGRQGGRAAGREAGRQGGREAGRQGGSLSRACEQTGLGSSKVSLRKKGWSGKQQGVPEEGSTAGERGGPEGPSATSPGLLSFSPARPQDYAFPGECCGGDGATAVPTWGLFREPRAVIRKCSLNVCGVW